MATYVNLDTIQRPATGLVAASTWGAQVNDDVATLYGDTAWTTFPYATGWSSNTGFAVAGYRRFGTQVVCRGWVGDSSLVYTAGTGYTIGTLPTGYQPAAQEIVGVITRGSTSSSFAAAAATISTAGVITVTPSTSGTGLNVIIRSIVFDLIA